jgi:hypothetical protein
MVATAIIGSAIVGAGSSLYAGSQQADAAERAGGVYANAQMASVAEQRRQYNQTREDFAPWRETGATAVEEYGRLYGVGRDGLVSDEERQGALDRFETSPGYQFRMDEGIKAFDRSASAKGQLSSGGTGKALTRYAQGVASDEFGSYASRLAQLAGAGQQATGSTAAAGASTASNISNTLMAGAKMQGNAIQNAATARASGYVGASNAASGGVGNYMLWDYMNRQPQTSTVAQ